MVPPELVAETVKLLAPALPALIAAGGKVVEKVGGAAGDAVVVEAKKIWARLVPHVEKQPALLEAAQEVAARPDDGDAEGALRVQLRKLLEAQPQLVAELTGLLPQNALQQNTVHNSGAGAVVAGGDMKGNTITTRVNR